MNRRRPWLSGRSTGPARGRDWDGGLATKQMFQRHRILLTQGRNRRRQLQCRYVLWMQGSCTGSRKTESRRTCRLGVAWHTVHSGLWMGCPDAGARSVQWPSLPPTNRLSDCLTTTMMPRIQDRRNTLSVLQREGFAIKGRLDEICEGQYREAHPMRYAVCMERLLSHKSTPVGVHCPLAAVAGWRY